MFYKSYNKVIKNGWFYNKRKIHLIYLISEEGIEPSWNYINKS